MAGSAGRAGVVREGREGREVAHSQISLAIVTLFITCHAVRWPQSLPSLYPLMLPCHRWVPTTWELLHSSQEADTGQVNTLNTPQYLVLSNT